MKKSVIYFSVLFSVLIGFQCNSQVTADLEQINSEIWNNFTESFETLEYDLFASLHHSEFIRISGDSGTIKNKEQYINGYQNQWQNADLNQTISFRFLERIANGQIASERGIYNLTINPDSQNSKSYYGKFHVILKKESGKWLILVDYDSSEKNTIGKSSFESAFAINDFSKY